MEPIYYLRALFFPCVLIDTLRNWDETDALYVLWCPVRETAFVGQLQVERVVYSIFAVCLFLTVPSLIHTPRHDTAEETARVLNILKDKSMWTKCLPYVWQYVLGRSSDTPDKPELHNLVPDTKEKIVKAFEEYKLGCGICDSDNWEHRTFLQDWAANACMYAREALRVIQETGYNDRPDMEYTLHTYIDNILQVAPLRSWFRMFSTVDASFNLLTEDVIEKVLPKYRLIVKEVIGMAINEVFEVDKGQSEGASEETDYLYHYSDNAWIIWNTRRLKPSLLRKDAKFGQGIYFTAVQNTKHIRSFIRDNNYDGKTNEDRRHSIWKVQHCVKIPKRLIPGVEQRVHHKYPERNIWVLPTVKPFTLPAQAQLESFYRICWEPAIIRMINASDTPILALVIIFLVHVFTGSLVHLVCFGCFWQMFDIDLGLSLRVPTYWDLEFSNNKDREPCIYNADTC